MATWRTVYRAASYGSPLRVEPSRRSGRFHRRGDPAPTQYACDHPLGPWAELIRAHDLRTVEELRELRARTWALRVDVASCVVIDFADAARYGIDAGDLVSDDLAACQALADRQRAAGVPGLIVPSAALPGTRCVVLFGERVASGYLDEPIDPALEIPASMTADPGQPPATLLARVRRRGQPHPGAPAAGFAEPDWSLHAAP